MSQMCGFPFHGVSRPLAGTLPWCLAAQTGAGQLRQIWLHEAGGRVSSEPQAPSIFNAGLALTSLLQAAGQAICWVSPMQSWVLPGMRLLNCP